MDSYACLPCIKSMLMLVASQSHMPIQLIWITNTNTTPINNYNTNNNKNNISQHNATALQQTVLSKAAQMQLQLEHMRNTQYVDSTYYYLVKHVPIGHRILYINHHMHITHINTTIAQRTKHNILIQCPQYTTPHWLPTDISGIDSRVAQQCVYLYDPVYLRMITPTNLQYHNLYTLPEILVYPLLALAQSISYGQFAQIQSYSPPKTHAPSQQSAVYFQLHPLYAIAYYELELCFVCASTLPSANNVEELMTYLAQFEPVQANQYDRTKINVILSMVYPLQVDLTPVFNIIQSITNKNTHISIRFRLRYEHVSAPLQVFQVVHAYCSHKSVIISSRANATPNLASIVEAVRQAQLCKNDQYLLLGNYMMPNNATTNLSPLQLSYFSNPTQKQVSRSQYDHYYHTHMFHALISCSMLMLELELDVFKWQETQFYETQYSYSIPVLEKARNNYTFTQNALFTLHSTRKQSDKQLMQIQGLKLRKKFTTVQQRSALNNYGYKKNTKPIIPKILHQIWLSNKQDVSPVKKALMETLIKSNPQFQHKLWKLQDITKHNFPFTYEGIMKYLQLTKETKINYKVLAADLMRIQILYREGGIYLDMKVQGRKSLLPFLKFQQFFLFANSKNLVNGIIGSIKGHRAFRKILETYFNPKNLGLPDKHIYDQTGGPVLVKAYTRKQIYARVLNFAQFAIQGERPCIFGNFGKEPESDQTIYEGKTSKRQKYRIFIPCKQKTDKYVELYNVLGRTYLPTASEYY